MAKGSYTLKLASSSTGTANSAASVSVPRSGRIIAVEWSCYGLGGAGVDGRIFFECSRQSVSTVGTNDTAELSIAHATMHANIASSACSTNNSTAGIAAPVEAGARLYINQVAGGTAFAAINATCLLHILEG